MKKTGMNRNEKKFKNGKKKDWKKTSHQYPSPTLRGRNSVESAVADLAARMVKTTLDSNLGELDFHIE